MYVMDYINVYGLLFTAVILIPNVIFAVKCKDGFVNKWSKKWVEIVEQVGRFGCLAFMIFKGIGFGFRSPEAVVIYLVVDVILVLAYCIIWAVCFQKNSMFRALSLSILPSVLFLFSGIISHSILLTIFAVLFAPSHIAISYQNAK